MFNARAEYGSALNRNFLRNRWLWISLGGGSGATGTGGALGSGPGHFPHDRAELLQDWGLAALVASSVLVFDECRKLLKRLLRRGFG